LLDFGTFGLAMSLEKVVEEEVVVVESAGVDLESVGVVVEVDGQLVVENVTMLPSFSSHQF